MSHDEELYDVAPEPQPAAPARAKVTATYGGPPLPSAGPATPVLPYQSAKVAAGGADAYFANKTIDLHAPIWIITASVLVEVVAAMIRSRGGTISFVAALSWVGIQIVVGTALMLAGVFIAARMRQFSLGHFWTAVLKLAAVSVGPDAAITLVAPFFSVIPIIGGLLNWLLGFVLYCSDNSIAAPHSGHCALSASPRRL